MPSVFDDPRETLAPPTWEELEERLGDPALSFAVGDPEIRVPGGLLACCRVVHQPHCPSHVAMSLVGCHFVIRLLDGTEQERTPFRQVHEGDVLARPMNLKAAVEAARLMAIATADVQGGRLASMAFDIWTLDLETAEIYRYLHAERQGELGRLIADADGSSTGLIEALPIELLDPEDRGAIAELMADPAFHHVTGYADRVLVLPSEIGHTDAARYITSAVIGTPDDVSPAAQAITRDPTEVR